MLPPDSWPELLLLSVPAGFGVSIIAGYIRVKLDKIAADAATGLLTRALVAVRPFRVGG